MSNKVSLRKFGNTGLLVSPLGYGAGHIGSPDVSEDWVGELLNRVVDLGINLIDTAKGYGLSEERIGRHLSYRRSDFVLSTKVGYGIEGYQDWTYDCVKAGIDKALETMQTDYLDIVHLHSCEQKVLEQGGSIRALKEAKAEGKVKVMAYSGENDDLTWAVASGEFDSIQTSANFCDQRGIEKQISNAKAKGLGVIAKRPLANAPWRFTEKPVGHYCEPYWERLQLMEIDAGAMSWNELALRFAVFATGADSSIVGSLNMEHIIDNYEIIKKGPLPKKIVTQIKNAFKKFDDNWIGQV